MHTISKSAFILLLLICGGCSDTGTGVLSPSAGSGSSALTAGSVAGQWRLAAVQVAGMSEQTAPAGASYRLTVTDDRASLAVDCNVCNGAVAVNGQTMTVGPRLGCTLAACPTMDFGNQYLGVLAGDSAAQLTGNTLELTSGRGRVRFTR